MDSLSIYVNLSQQSVSLGIFTCGLVSNQSHNQLQRESHKFSEEQKCVYFKATWNRIDILNDAEKLGRNGAESAVCHEQSI